MRIFLRLLLSLTLAQALTGCWGLQFFRPWVPGNSRLAAWNYHHLGVATFDDATFQATGEKTAHIFTETLARELGGVSVKHLSTRPPDVGFFDFGQTKKVSRAYGVQGILTGRVMLHQWDPRERIAEIVVASRLMDGDRGFIIWARTVTGRSQAPPLVIVDRKAEFRRATASAAKELVDDLLAPPVQNAFLPDGGERRYRIVGFSR